MSAAILRPFLDSLFDDNREGPGNGAGKQTQKEEKGRHANEEIPLAESVGATIGVSGMPSMRYHDALRRETAKPFVLNTVISIDAAPLPTRTAPPVYVELLQQRTGDPPQHAACLRHEYREALRKSFTQVLRASTASPTKSPQRYRGTVFDTERDDDSSAMPVIESGPGAQNMAGVMSSMRPPEIYSQVKQSRMLEDAHLEMLMRTVKQTREMSANRKMWGDNNIY